MWRTVYVHRLTARPSKLPCTSGIFANRPGGSTSVSPVCLASAPHPAEILGRCAFRSMRTTTTIIATTMAENKQSVRANRLYTMSVVFMYAILDARLAHKKEVVRCPRQADQVGENEQADQQWTQVLHTHAL